MRKMGAEQDRAGSSLRGNQLGECKSAGHDGDDEDQATEELAAASMLGGSVLLLDVKGGQAERVADRVGVDAAVVIRLEVIP